jgi:HD superfamily phosphohydrolase
VFVGGTGLLRSSDVRKCNLATAHAQSGEPSRPTAIAPSTRVGPEGRPGLTGRSAEGEGGLRQASDRRHAEGSHDREGGSALRGHAVQRGEQRAGRKEGERPPDDRGLREAGREHQPRQPQQRVQTERIDGNDGNHRTTHATSTLCGAPRKLRQSRVLRGGGPTVRPPPSVILRDPVHGLVAFERPAERLVLRLLDTREVQRLRRVRALGVTSLAFPGAEHSRFAHSVGATHVMSAFLTRIRGLDGDFSAHDRPTLEDEQMGLSAALLHDLGHGPLSHLFEDVFVGAPAHEEWTTALLRDPDSQVHQVLHDVDPAMPAAVDGLVHGRHPKAWLAHAVSGTFDVDRCDYLLRDSYMTGVRYGLYDLPWLLRSLRVVRDARGAATIAVDGSKGLPAVEGFFLARLFMYQQVYFHKASRAAERMIRAVFSRAADLALQEDGHAASLPPVMLRLARGERISPAEYASLDDGTLWSTIERWESEATDPVLRDLSARLRRRALFKTATLDEDDLDRGAELLESLREIVRGAGFDPRYYTALDVASTALYDEPSDAAEALHVVYNRRSPRTLSRASLLLAKLRGERLEARRLVFPAEVRDQVGALLGRASQLALALPS